MDKKYPAAYLFFSVAAMGAVILVSNELVQHPVQGVILGIDFSEVLTWGAFTLSLIHI